MVNLTDQHIEVRAGLERDFVILHEVQEFNSGDGAWHTEIIVQFRHTQSVRDNHKELDFDLLTLTMFWFFCCHLFVSALHLDHSCFFSYSFSSADLLCRPDMIQNR